MDTDEPRQPSTTPKMGQAMSFEGWKAIRRKQTAGMLTLVGVHEVKAGAGEIGDLPGVWRADPGGVSLTARAADDIKVGGELIAGTTHVDPAAEITLSPTRTARVDREAYGAWFVKVWDENAPGLTTFSHIETYPHDPDWAVAAELRPGDPNRRFQVARMTDPGVSDPREAPADVHFSWAGSDYSLVCLATASDAVLLVSFTDATSGGETPSGGRMLILPRGPAGPVVLDFNQAMLPPHDFSAAVPCPSTLPENRLPFAVTAGEKRLVWRG